MYNVFFCADGASIVELMPTDLRSGVTQPRGLPHNIIWHSSVMLGLDYWRIPLQSGGTGDVTADLPKLERILTKIEGENKNLARARGAWPDDAVDGTKFLSGSGSV